MKTYGQFCPVAKAAEIFAERWTPLIIRELLMGSRKFSELEIGMAHIPRSLLTQRLRTLEDAGLLIRETVGSRKRPEYHLTEAGADLFDVVKGLGDLVVGPGRVAGKPFFGGRPRGDEDDLRRDAVRRGQDPTTRFVAVETRHHDVEQQDVGLKLGELGQTRFTACHRRDFVVVLK